MNKSKNKGLLETWTGAAPIEAAMIVEPKRAAILKVIKHARDTHQPCEFGPLLIDTVQGHQPGYRIKLKGHAMAFLSGTWVSLTQTGARPGQDNLRRLCGFGKTSVGSSNVH